MVITVEPGLYFQRNDSLAPADMRGIGVRIEDDILVTDDGARILSAALPRSADEVEAWMADAALLIHPAGYDEAAVLIAELDADLARRYDDGEAVIAHAAQFTAEERGVFFIAWVGDEAAGCAGLRREAGGIAELKRMWVRTAFRGRGIARALLARCETEAAALGYAELWLETGAAQPEAVALYESSGYRPVPTFGQWAGSPDSITLGKRLATG